MFLTFTLRYPKLNPVANFTIKNEYSCVENRGTKVINPGKLQKKMYFQWLLIYMLLAYLGKHLNNGNKMGFSIEGLQEVTGRKMPTMDY